MCFILQLSAQTAKMEDTCETISSFDDNQTNSELDSSPLNVIQKYCPILHDKSQQGFHNIIQKAKAWQKIAEQMNKTLEECQLLYKSFEIKISRVGRSHLSWQSANAIWLLITHCNCGSRTLSQSSTAAVAVAVTVLYCHCDCEACKACKASKACDAILKPCFGDAEVCVAVRWVQSWFHYLLATSWSSTHDTK